MSFKYNLEHEFRGTALIIGNEFKGQRGQRAGCQEDIIMMEELFRRLDFNVTTFMNLSAAQMKEKLEQASRNINNEKSDCFVFVLSTHGHEVKEVKLADRAHISPPEADIWRHGVLGEDGTTLFVDEITDIFSDDNSYRLAGKPKFFFFQACRSRPIDVYFQSPGDTYDAGHQVKVVTSADKTSHAGQRAYNPDKKDSDDWLYTVDLTDAEDIYTSWDKDPDVWCRDTMAKTAGSQVSEEDAAGGMSEEDAGGSGDSNQIPPSPFDIIPINCPDDFLIMYPVMSGKFAFRNSRAGSYLLKFLHKNLAKLLQGCNVLQYLTQVSKDMAEYEYKPNLEAIMTINRQKALQARQRGLFFDELGEFKNHLYGNIKYLSREENQEMLVEMIGEGHRDNLKGDVTRVEPYLQGIIGRLTEQQMKDILNAILPFKMAACVVHRLKDTVHFLPKKKNTPMGLLWNMIPKETYV